MPVVLVAEQLQLDGLRPCTEPAYGKDLVAVREVDHDGCDARDVDQVALYHAERDARGDTGVDGIAAGLKHLKTGLRREVVPTRYHVPGAHDGRAQRIRRVAGPRFRWHAGFPQA